MDNQLDQSTVYKWLEADEERAKTVITSYLNGNKQFLKELTETTTAQQQLLLTPPPAQRRQRLSVVAPPPPLLNTEHAGEHPLQRLTSGPIVSPRKSADELRKLSKNELFMELLRDVVSPDFDINSLSHKILVNVLILINADRSSLFLVEGPKESPILVSRLFDVTEHSSLHEVLHDESEAIKIPFGVGIVGQAAKTGQVINIADAYKVENTACKLCICIYIMCSIVLILSACIHMIFACVLHYSNLIMPIDYHVVCIIMVYRILSSIQKLTS